MAGRIGALEGASRHMPLHALALHLRKPLYRNGYALMFSGGLTSALGMVYWVIAARSYPVQNVGANAALISAMMFLAGVSQLNLMSAMIRFLPRAGRAAARFVIQAYTLNAAVTVVVVFSAVVAAGRWIPELRFQHTDPLAAVSFVAAVIIWGIFSLQDNVLAGVRQAVWVPIENTLFSAGKILLLIALAASVRSYGIFLSWIIPAAIALVPINVLLFGFLIPRHARETEAEAEPIVLSAVARYVGANYLGSLFTLAATMLLPVIVTREAGARANAYFYQPWTIAYALQFIATTMTASLVVEGVRDLSNLSTYVSRVFVAVMRLLLPATVVLLLAAPYILRVFGDDYATYGTPVLRLLVLALIPGFVGTLFVGMARVQNRLMAIVVVQGAQSVLALGLSLLLLPAHGIMGVAVAWLSSQILVAAGLMCTGMRPLLALPFMTQRTG